MGQTLTSRQKPPTTYSEKVVFELQQQRMSLQKQRQKVFIGHKPVN